MNTKSINYRITFLRHGESTGNAEQRFQGQADFPLTEKGRFQAQRLAENWAAEGRVYDLCISSPLKRARQTAEIVANVLGLPIEFAAEWMEVHNGKIAGLSDQEAESVSPRPRFMTPYHHYGETGESRLELLLRAGKALQNLMDRLPQRLLVVAHGGILNMALYAALNISLHADGQGPRFMFGNTGFADLSYEPERNCWRMWSFREELNREPADD